ncbi:uncharacterized protein LOC131680059, partial [Topomyia yanbarensis]|uniref:uncharacterized protein LOC131680059 n=1 Tax=Topomyia yanbarensis TaxID=2498891 RepID=UPI00273ACBF5
SRILAVSKESAIYKHINGRFLNDPIHYPNRAQQASGYPDNGYCTSKELEACLMRKMNDIAIKPASICSDNEKAYFEKYIKVDIKKSIMIAIETEDQNTIAWKIHRASRITASSCYSLFTYIKNKSPNWDKKIESYWSIRNLNLKSTKYGKETESAAFDCYRRNRNPLIKRCGLVIHPTESWIGGSLDGLDPESGLLLEIKCPGTAEMVLHDILNSANVTTYAKHEESGEIILDSKLFYV